jgi:hydrogenase maturation protein HypF
LSFDPLLAVFADRPLDARLGAELFHGTLIEGLAALAANGADETGLSTLCLGGGCMMNRVLVEGLMAALGGRVLVRKGVDGGLAPSMTAGQAVQLSPLLARRLPPNDGGLSLGQAVLARRAFNQGG